MKEKNRLVVGDMSWADTIPEWLLDEIKAERMIYGMASIVNPEAEKVGDAELVAYLMTASMRAPMPSEYVEIYTYLTARVMARRKQELPDFLKEKAEKGLTDWEQHQLADLKADIYRKRGGDIVDPLLDAMRQLKKEIGRRPEPDHQLPLFSGKEDTI